MLTRITRLVPASNVSAALNYYSTKDTRVSFLSFGRDNLAAVIPITGPVFPTRSILTTNCTIR